MPVGAISRSRMARKQRMRRRRARFFGLLFSLLLIILAGYYFINSTLFNIKVVAVSGNRLIGREVILNLAAVPNGLNIFDLNLEAIEQRVKRLPLVKTVKVKRKIPATVQIAISERVPKARLPFGEGYAVIDKEGFCLTRVIAGSDNLPIITGIAPPPNFQPGQRLNNPNLDEALVMVQLMDQETIANLSEINVANRNRVFLYTNSGVQVRLGTIQNTSVKLELFREIMTQQKAQKTWVRVKYVDLSFAGDPVVSYHDSP